MSVASTWFESKEDNVLSWEMVTDAEGGLSDVIAHARDAAMGRKGSLYPTPKTLRLRALKSSKAQADADDRKGSCIITKSGEALRLSVR
jgi:hypothetical protein